MITVIIMIYTMCRLPEKRIKNEWVFHGLPILAFIESMVETVLICIHRGAILC
jgi:hypothetical protein